MSVKRLKVVSGELDSVAVAQTPDARDRIVRKAVLVHAGANGTPVTFGSADGEISFDDARIQAVVDSQNDLIDKLAAHYGGIGSIPPGAFPPILDQHEADSTNRVIGRLTGRLSFERRSVPKVGDDVACAIAEITFLGEETVQRVLDGRIFHLSIGIDEASNTLTETSAVIDPAAPGAMILKRGQVKAAKPAKGARNMDDIKKLAAQARADVKTLKATMVATRTKFDLAAARTNVVKRLSAVVKSGKLTPAEYRKMDISKLAAKSKEAFDAFVEGYEAREPQVLPGQHGTSNAMPLLEVGSRLEKKQTKRLKGEIRADFKRMGQKLKVGVDDDEEEAKRAAGDDKDDTKMETDDNTVPVVEEGGQDLAEIQQQMDEMNTQVSRIAGIVSDLVDKVDASTEPDPAAEEPSELEKDPEKKPEALEAEGKDDDDKKELAEDDKSEDDKDKKDKQSE